MVNNICYVLGTLGPSFFSMSVSPDVIRLLLCIPRSFLSAFLLSVSFYEPLLISLLASRLDVPFSVRAPLHDLLAFVQPEVVSVLP